MSDPCIYGVSVTGDCVFTAIFNETRNRWNYTHKLIPGSIGNITGSLEGVVSILLATFPDIAEIRYTDKSGVLRTSNPAHAIPNHLSKLVAEELINGR